MFGYKKSPMAAAGKKLSVTYRDFRVFGEGGKETLYGVDSLNCDLRDGALRTGIGALPYTLKNGTAVNLTSLSGRVDGFFSVDTMDTPAAAVYDEELLLVTEDGKLWVLGGSGFLGGGLVGMDASAATALNKNSGEQCTIVVGSNRSFLIVNGSIQGVALPNTTAAICTWNNRIFVGSKVFKVAYSAPEKAFVFSNQTIDGSGTLYLPTDRGELVALRTFQGKVYAFCERGIFRLQADGAAREFKLVEIAYGGGKIFGKTVGNCGDVIFFLAQDGLYRMRGEVVKRVCKHLPIRPNRDSQICNHGTVGDDFIVRYIEGNFLRRTLVVDSEGKDGYFTSDFEGLSEHDGKTLCRYLNGVGTMALEGALPMGGSYYFLSKKVDFGNQGKKTLKGLKFEGTGSFVCEVIVDGKSFSKQLSFVNGVAVFYPRLRGKEFQFRFTLSRGAVIRSMTAETVAL